MPSSMAQLVNRRRLNSALAVWAVVPDRRECQIANMKPHYRTMLEMQGLRGGLGPALRHAMF